MRRSHEVLLPVRMKDIIFDAPSDCLQTIRYFLIVFSSSPSHVLGRSMIRPCMRWRFASSYRIISATADRISQVAAKISTGVSEVNCPQPPAAQPAQDGRHRDTKHPNQFARKKPRPLLFGNGDCYGPVLVFHFSTSGSWPTKHQILYHILTAVHTRGNG